MQPSDSDGIEAGKVGIVHCVTRSAAFSLDDMGRLVLPVYCLPMVICNRQIIDPPQLDAAFIGARREFGTAHEIQDGLTSEAVIDVHASPGL